MVAEPTLFLTKDRSVQVRAHTSSSGKEFFCVMDFVRQTARERMGPDDALIYWVLSVLKLTHEREILDCRMILFEGPYEKPQVCLSAAGLLILYHHLAETFNLVNISYKSEVQSALMEIISAGSAGVRIEMFDDGEIEQQLAEIQLKCNGVPGSAPPKGSIFNYVPLGAPENIEKCLEPTKPSIESDHDDIPSPPQEPLQSKQSLQEPLQSKHHGFSLGSLMKEGTFNSVNRNSLCKAVISIFRSRYPTRKTFMRHGTVFFYSKDRPVVEGILRLEYQRLLLEKE